MARNRDAEDDDSPRAGGEPRFADTRPQRPTRLMLASAVLVAWTSLLGVYGFFGASRADHADASLAELNRVLGQILGAFGVVGLLLAFAAFAGYRAGAYLLVAWALAFSALLVLFLLGGFGLLALIPLTLTVAPVAVLMSPRVRAWYPH